MRWIAECCFAKIVVLAPNGLTEASSEMWVLPCSICFADACHVDVEVFQALHVILVVFASRGVGKTVSILKEDSEPTRRPLVDTVTKGQMFIWILALAFGDTVGTSTFGSFQESRASRDFVGVSRLLDGGTCIYRGECGNSGCQKHHYNEKRSINRC